MKVWKKILLSLLSVLLLLFIAGLVWKKELKAAILPEVETFKVSRVSVLNDSARVDLHLVIRNKDFINYNLRSLEIEALNDTLHLLRYSNDSLFVLKKGEERSVDLHVMLPIKRIIKRIRNLQNTDSTEIVIRGTAFLATRAGDIELPINKVLTVRVPTPPKIEVSEVEYLGAEGSEYSFNIKLGVTNRSDQKLEVKNVSYEFFGEDLLESKGKYAKEIHADPGKTYFMELPVKVEANDRLEILSRVIRDKDVIDYTIRIKGVIEAVAGIEEDIPVVFTRTGNFELVDRSRKPKFRITRK